MYSNQKNGLENELKLFSYIIIYFWQFDFVNFLKLM